MDSHKTLLSWRPQITPIMDDSDVLRQVWTSYLPVCFSLAQNEVTSLQEPDPYYAMVSRLSYLPLVLDKVLKHFSKDSKDLWIDFEGTPLKWHYPIGLLFDLMGSSLPWNLTIHFTDFPDDQLVRCSSRASIESLFMSAVKEADALKHRSQVMTGLQKKDHGQLWSGVCNDKFDQFWAINRKLMDLNDFRFIPFRVYCKDLTQKQKLIKPKTESGDDTVFRDLCESFADNIDDYKWIIHGIEPPMDTPLLWMSQHLSYSDNFLHICALKKS